MAARAPRQNRKRADGASDATNTPQADEDSQVTEWLGNAPKDPAQLEFEALQARFASRRDLLQHCIGTNDVVRLLDGQTPLQALRAGQLDRVLTEARAVGCGQD